MVGIEAYLPPTMLDSHMGTCSSSGLCYISSFLLIYLGKQQVKAQILGPHIPCSWLQHVPTPAVVAIWETNQRILCVTHSHTHSYPHTNSQDLKHRYKNRNHYPTQRLMCKAIRGYFLLISTSLTLSILI